MHGHEVQPLGSTFQAKQTGDLLRANDTWFAPTDMALGPDGRVYIADWHDRRTAHPDPDADWDRSNGRIFAIGPPGTRPLSEFDSKLDRKAIDELFALLYHPNTWYRRKARRMLAERRAAIAADTLRKTALQGRAEEALEALWALHGCAGLDEPTTGALLGHHDPDVRAWCVRLLADGEDISALDVSRLVAMAGREADVVVRAQLASSARRLPRAAALDVAAKLLAHEEDAGDEHIPLLLWWAVEAHALEDVEDTLRRFRSAGGVAVANVPLGDSASFDAAARCTEVARMRHCVRTPARVGTVE